jgi:hypothetical protein
MNLRLFTGVLLLTLTACSNEDKAWELAEREDTNQGYLEFLAKYPDGGNADRARQRMQELKEIRSWERAQFRDRAENYRRFLEQYPDSENAPVAVARIYELERDAAWGAARDSGDVNTLQTFLSVYPDAPQAWEAEQLLAALLPAEPEPPPEPAGRAGDFRLQLGAFRTAKAADTEVRRLAPLFNRVLPGPVRIVTPAETGGRFFLLHTPPLSGEEARLACDALKAAGQVCLRINR